MQIKTIEELKSESKERAEFFIRLGETGQYLTRKTIQWDEEEKNFYIFNHIDSTFQYLTENEIMDKEYTNIGEAMQKGALFKSVESSKF